MLIEGRCLIICVTSVTWVATDYVSLSVYHSVITKYTSKTTQAAIQDLDDFTTTVLQSQNG